LERPRFLFFLARVGGIVYAGSVVRRYMRDPNSARSLILTLLLLTAGYAIEEFHYGYFHVLAVALRFIGVA
jgi:hypothetical protein